VCAVLTIGTVAHATVTIQTVDGRTLAGEVDARTTVDHLWIRQQEEGIILATPVLWDAIAAASLDGEPIEVPQLIERSHELATAVPFGFLQEPSLYELANVGHDPPHAEVPVPLLGGRITALEAEAVLINLDRDVEPDGYELQIAAVDDHSQNVAVEGELYVRLMVERDVHHTGRIRFEDIQQWTQPVTPHDFVDGLASYVLPFRAFHPEFDDELRPDAQITVRLGVFGEGNFATTIAVPLWNFNPFKDRLQMFDGSRFYRDELSRYPRHTDYHSKGIYYRPWSW